MSLIKLGLRKLLSQGLHQNVISALLFIIVLRRRCAGLKAEVSHDKWRSLNSLRRVAVLCPSREQCDLR